ncbi:hypothetical protein J6590_025049 [Homalodisca vitripennis]|nr:hypothetical protein J6590_025049 [Homalodisca vitripennis]
MSASLSPEVPMPQIEITLQSPQGVCFIGSQHGAILGSLMSIRLEARSNSNYDTDRTSQEDRMKILEAHTAQVKSDAGAIVGYGLGLICLLKGDNHVDGGLETRATCSCAYLGEEK